MYSLMSKRMNSTPSACASCLASLGLADAGRAREQEGADRLVRLPEAGARQLDRRRQRLDRLSWPKTDRFSSRLELLAAARVSEMVTLLRRDLRHRGDDALDVPGTYASSCVVAGGRSCTMAPASSITSMALSGRYRSLMYLADSSAAARKRRVGVGHAVVLLVVRFEPSRSARSPRRDGSAMSIFWKRRASARSVSKWFLYSS